MKHLHIKPVYAVLLLPILLPFFMVVGAVAGIMVGIAFTLMLAHEAGRMIMRGYQ